MQYNSLYILKVRGIKDNASYLQIRDENFSLLGNLRYISPYENLIRFFNHDKRKLEIVLATVKEAEYGKLLKIEF